MSGSCARPFHRISEVTVPASNIAVVYGANSKIIRAIHVSDTDAELALIKAAPGEGLLLLPFKDYSLANAEQVAAMVAQKIGLPLHDGIVAEVDSQGKVVRVIMGDTDFPLPKEDPSNTHTPLLKELIASVVIGEVVPVTADPVVPDPVVVSDIGLG